MKPLPDESENKHCPGRGLWDRRENFGGKIAAASSDRGPYRPGVKDPRSERALV